MLDWLKCNRHFITVRVPSYHWHFETEIGITDLQLVLTCDSVPIVNIMSTVIKGYVL